MHIFLMLKFYKAITPRFSSFRICYHFDLLDWPVGFEFSAQLGFACVVVDASNKQRSKGICGGLSVTLRVPQSNSLFQFVRHLFFFFPLFPLHPTQKKGIISTLNHVKKQICICTTYLSSRDSIRVGGGVSASSSKLPSTKAAIP